MRFVLLFVYGLVVSGLTTVNIHRVAGLGHKTSNIVCGWNIAQSLNDTYYLDPAPLRNSQHGKYEIFPKWLDTRDVCTPKTCPGTIKEYSENSCWTNCTGCYTKALPFMRKLFGNYKPPAETVFGANDNNTVNAAWHLRHLSSDVVKLTAEIDALKKRAEQIYPHKSVKHHFFVEDIDDEIEALFQMKVPQGQFWSCPAELTLQHLASADVAVGTGSSFFFIAQFLSDDPFYLSLPPKEEPVLPTTMFYSTPLVEWVYPNTDPIHENEDLSE